VLDPMERISEVLFGLIMVLAYTGSLSVATADRLQMSTMILGALSCNFAWGVIDAAMYLMTQLNERGHKILLLRAVRKSADSAAAQRIIADTLPPLLASLLPLEQSELMRRKLQQMPEPAVRPQLTGRDGLGAIGVCLLVFLSTLPVVIPFMFIADPRLALRVSNAVAIALLFLCGYAFGRYAGFRPWASGLTMVAIGSALVAVASALGG
jgi:hypothetical protein